MKTKLLLLILCIPVLNWSQTPKKRLIQIIDKTYDTANDIFKISELENFKYDDNDVEKNLETNYATWDDVSNSQKIQNKYEYTYYPDGKMESKTYFYHDNNLLNPEDKKKFLFNNDGQLSEIIELEYDNNTNQFINDEKETYIYNSSDDPYPNLVEMYNWNTSTNSWKIDMKALITYNSNWDYTKILIQKYNNNSQEFIDRMEYLRNFDSNNQLVEIIQKRSNGNELVNDVKIEYNYIENGNELTYEITTNIWNRTDWEPEEKLIIIEDSNIKNLLSSEYYYYELNNSKWIGDEKTIYTYSADTITEKFIEWDDANSVWFPESTEKIVYNYDSNNTLDIIFPVNISNKEPNVVYDLLDDKIPHFKKYYYKKLNEEIVYSRNNINDPWEYLRKKEYVYEQITGINQLTKIKGNAYPIPSNDFIIFKLEKSNNFELTLSNINGQIVYNGYHKNGDKIMINNLPTGIYFYKIFTTKGIKQGKIIKQ